MVYWNILHSDEIPGMEYTRTKGPDFEGVVNSLQWKLSSRIYSGVMYGIRFSAYRPQLALAELSTAQSFLLAMFHSLLTGDIALCSALLDLCSFLEHLRSPHMIVWLRDDFVFPSADVTLVLRTLSRFTESGRVNIPHDVVMVFIGLAKQYGVAARCKALQDSVTLQFLASYDVPLTADVGTMTICIENVSSPCFNKLEEPEAICLADRITPLTLSSDHKQPDYPPDNTLITETQEEEEQATFPCSNKVEEPGTVSLANCITPLTSSSVHKPDTTIPWKNTQPKEEQLQCLTHYCTELELTEDHPLLSNVDDDSNYDFLIGMTDATDIELQSSLSALHLAAQSGQSTLVRELLLNGANPAEKESRYGNTAAHWAIKTDNVDVLYWLLRHGANLSFKNNQGLTPLHLAAESGKIRTLTWLLNNGADMEAKDNCEMTPLARAAYKGQMTTSEILLARGAEVDSRDHNLRTPLFHAVIAGHHCMVRLLLQRDADASLKDIWSKTLLHVAIAGGDLITFHYVYKQRIDLEAKDCNGRTALHYAAEFSDCWALTTLLEKGSDIEATDLEGRTPLFLAVADGRLEAVRQLLQSGANCNTLSRGGLTPIDVATDSRIKGLLLSGGKTYTKL